VRSPRRRIVEHTGDAGDRSGSGSPQGAAALQLVRAGAATAHRKGLTIPSAVNATAGSALTLPRPGRRQSMIRARYLRQIPIQTAPTFRPLRPA
jgi:hypothetical protein